MNQQRARRFKTAEANSKLKDSQIESGGKVEKSHFDSNCITPGTEFMTKLSLQLKYFVHKKVTEDSNWRNIQVILSGHETPGEGEHKIMEYIRLTRSMKGYNPNTRHCIYGLDADLIMLGLVTHEPHTSLLREIQTFGRKQQKLAANQVKFHLLHLSLLREYFDLDFGQLKDEMKIKYDLERVIDDIILICMFIGNDFIPHLPEFHIHDGALDYVVATYKQWLLTAEDYLHTNGTLNIKPFDSFLRAIDKYESNRIQNMEDKKDSGGNNTRKKKNSGSNQLEMTIAQNTMYQKAKSLLTDPTLKGVVLSNEDLPQDDLDFMDSMLRALSLNPPSRSENSDGTIQYSLELTSDQEDFLRERLEGDTDASDSEAEMAINRVLKRYDQAKITQPQSKNDIQQAAEAKHHNFKKEYYYEKMKIDISKPEELRPLVSAYIRGLQWVLYYYYRGIQSWGWYYPYHYAPMLTDLVDIADFSMEFEFGKPFLPFQQLMGVLPKLSGDLVPPAFRVLMDNPMSSIQDFYSTDFETDENGKKNDWEYVILIPFIDQDRLVKALKEQEHLLTEEEKRRNTFQEPTTYHFDITSPKTFKSSLPGFLPDLDDCPCYSEVYKLPTLAPGQDFTFGLLPGVKLGEESPSGFPSLYTSEFTSVLAHHSVFAFQQPSKRESIVITLKESELSKLSASEFAKKFLGKSVYIEWPNLKEAIVTKVSDKSFNYILDRGQVIEEPHSGKSLASFESSCHRRETDYSRHYALVIGQIEVLVYTSSITGMSLNPDGSIMKRFEGYQEGYALQTVITSVKSQDPRYIESAPCPMSQDFPAKSRVFMLGEPYYGAAAHVISSGDTSADLKLLSSEEPVFSSSKLKSPANQYVESYHVARNLKISPLILSKITSSLHVILPDGKVDIGLGLKFEGKKQKVIGYTEKSDKGWSFSQNAINLVKEYIVKFPEIIQTLNNRDTSDMLVPTDLYPKETALEQIAKIREWLKLSNCHNLTKANIEADALPKEMITEIASFWDEHHSGPRQPYTVVQVTKVPRITLLKPSLAEHVIKFQYFDLGDRIIYIKDNGSVPLGSRGTVVGKNSGEVDVLFDKGFIGGTDLGGICPQFRGSTLPFSSVLNITKPQFSHSCTITPKGPIYTPIRSNVPIPRFNQSSSPASPSSPRNNYWANKNNSNNRGPRPPKFN
jgi:5'-3' exoribonuclease 1